MRFLRYLLFRIIINNRFYLVQLFRFSVFQVCALLSLPKEVENLLLIPKEIPLKTLNSHLQKRRFSVNLHSNYWSRGRVARQRSAKPRTAVRIRSRPLQKASPNRDAFFVSCPPIQEAKNRTRSVSLISEKRFGDYKKKTPALLAFLLGIRLGNFTSCLPFFLSTQQVHRCHQRQTSPPVQASQQLLLSSLQEQQPFQELLLLL